MGFRFRKSINLGGGFKINLSKSGVGYSWGTKGARFTKTATGKNRPPVSIPGTGISYVTETGEQKRMSQSNAQHRNTNSDDGRENTMAWIKLAVCFFLGVFGVHKFMEKKTGMGVLYLFTGGLFGIGWIIDCVKYLTAALKTVSSNAVKSDDAMEPPMDDVEVENHPVELPPEDTGNKIKKVLLWVVVAFFGLLALGGGVLSALAAAGLIALIIPIKGWQAKIKTFMKGKLKA